METRNPVEGSFGSEFPSIYNECEVNAAWSCKTLKLKLKFFCIFSKKRPLTVKISKFSSESFHRDTDRRAVFKFRKIWQTGNRLNRALPTWKKFRLALQLSLLSGLRPKSAKTSPRQCTHSVPDIIQIGSLSAELWLNAWTPQKRAVKWIQYSAEA